MTGLSVERRDDGWDIVGGNVDMALDERLCGDGDLLDSVMRGSTYKRAMCMMQRRPLGGDGAEARKDGSGTMADTVAVSRARGEQRISYSLTLSR